MKLKIFLLIMFLLGFFVVGTKIVKSEVVDPIGTCFCDVLNGETEVTSFNNIVPFVESNCINQLKSKSKIEAGVTKTVSYEYKNCRWVDSSQGTCRCTVQFINQTLIFPDLLIGVSPEKCKEVTFEDVVNNTHYQDCVYKEPPAPGLGCYCDYYDSEEKIITGYLQRKVAITKSEDCVDSVEHVNSENVYVKLRNCEWGDKTPSPTPTPVATPSTPVITEGLASLPTVAGSVSTLSGGGGNTAGSAAAGGVSWVKIENPLSNNVTDFRVILSNLINAGMGILGSVTLLVFVYGGFLWLVSAGSPEKIKKGSQAMLWAVIGLFLVFGSYAIMGIVLQGIGARQQAEQSSGPAEVTKIPASVPLSP